VRIAYSFPKKTLCTIAIAGNRTRNMRIQLLHPTTHWDRVWENLMELGRRTPYEIVPTNERLYTTRLTDSTLCKHCLELYTIMHSLTECGEWERIWDWTRKRIAWILRTDPARIPRDWTLRPQFQDVTEQCYGYSRTWCGSGYARVEIHP
jgi:hypothetical protein